MIVVDGKDASPDVQLSLLRALPSVLCDDARNMLGCEVETRRLEKSLDAGEDAVLHRKWKVK